MSVIDPRAGSVPDPAHADLSVGLRESLRAICERQLDGVVVAPAQINAVEAGRGVSRADRQPRERAIVYVHHGDIASGRLSSRPSLQRKVGR